ncbi:MAG: pilus assembly protein PilP [Syntrophobacterales bacterium]|nr:pilus assembly protein PilP [Syntrophobacterales bacterium]
MRKLKGIVILGLVISAALTIDHVLSQETISTKESLESFKEDMEQPLDDKEKIRREKQQARQRALEMLFQKDFRYNYVVTIGNPFIPFVQPSKLKTPEEQLTTEAPPPPVLLTPLQKMELGEIERGFKGVLWSSNERKAIIEDATGKGYIVSVGTPIGTQDGVVSAIFQDRIVIRQKVWDSASRRFKEEEVVVKLRKKPDETTE